ncbi:hypothetical protein HDU98_009336 [Podochytrium sp. JEL0797]|nr:hypothetical protein HDU98_009336 [Podochytrium sp. JEL0797]
MQKVSNHREPLAADDDALPDLLPHAAKVECAVPPSIEWIPAFEAIGSTTNNLTALLAVRAASLPPQQEGPRTVGVDLVVCIDVSGSMKGSPLAAVKETLRYIASTLTEKDRICLISFTENAVQLTKFHVCVGDGLNKVTRAIEGLQAYGGTGIKSACDRALSVMRARAQKNGANAILLLSDGQDSFAHDYTTVLSDLEMEKVPIFTYGFGWKHDSRLLSRLAGKSGTFTYIPQVNVFQEAFAGCLGGIKSTIYKNLVISVTIPTTSPVTQIKQIQCSQNFSLISPTSVTIEFGDLFADEQRDVIVQLALTPPSPTPVSSDLVLSSYSYTDAFTNQQVTGVANGNFTVTILPSVDPSPYNPLVTRQLLRLKAIQRMEDLSATEQWLDESIASLKQILETAYNMNPLMAAEMDLTKEATRPACISTQEWFFVVAIAKDVAQCARLEERGAEASQMAMLSTYVSQRATYSSPDPANVGSTSLFSQASGYQGKMSSIVQMMSSYQPPLGYQ